MRRFHGVQEKDLGGAIQIEKDCGASVLSCFSPVLLFATPWTVTHQGPLSIEFSRQDYWSGLPFLSAGIFLTQGSNLGLIHCRQSLDYCPNHQGLQYWSAKWWGDENTRIVGGEFKEIKIQVNSYIHSVASVLPFLPALLPSLPLFLYLVGVISELCGSGSIWRLKFS